MRISAWTMAIAAAAAVSAPPVSAAGAVPPAPSLWLRTTGAWHRGHVVCNQRYPPGDGAALCPVDPVHPDGHLAIRPHGTLLVKVRGAQRVECELLRPYRDQPTAAHIAARLNVRRVAGSATRYRARLPGTLPARTTGVTCTADFRARHFASYDLGVRLPG
jgi:hypothetical protein